MKRRASFVTLARMLRPEYLCHLRFINWDIIPKANFLKGALRGWEEWVGALRRGVHRSLLAFCAS